MSRIGKHPVELAQGVSATLADGFISVKGPKGEVRMHVLPKVAIEQDGNVLSFKQLEETRESNANVGTMRALVADMNKGVSVGFEKKLTSGRRRLPCPGSGRQAQPAARLSRTRSCTRCPPA